jgi:hypothetical protein
MLARGVRGDSAKREKREGGRERERERERGGGRDKENKPLRPSSSDCNSTRRNLTGLAAD